MIDESKDLSEDAQAILAYARRWGAPFTRMEITDIAPGAAWDAFSRWPRTVARRDPLYELVKAGCVEEHDEQSVKSDKRGYKTYKRWKLTDRESVPDLEELLGQLLDACKASLSTKGIEAEILRRFGGDRA
jgi:hypothetical protein